MGFDPVAYINEPRWMESRLGLERIAELLGRLGNPQRKLRFVHVAGTNGKGSTCVFLARILEKAGYRTGLFTSPYIIEFSDRIQVDGANISDESLLSVTLSVKEAADAMADHPTEFELMTAVAFLHFARQSCDIVVCEVGLGGRLDSTNVIESPDVCIITSIGLDHMAVLGETLAAIAGEKAGIIKQGVPVVSWPQEPGAREVIEEAAARRGAPLIVPDFSRLEIRGAEGNSSLSVSFDYKGHAGLKAGMLGSYQPYNASLAIEAVEVLRTRGWHIGEAALREGLADAYWPGRFEIVAEHPTFVIDGAHNEAAVRVLVESLHATFPGVSPVFIMGVLADKDYGDMIRDVLPLASMIVTIAPPNPRALSADDLASKIRAVGEQGGYAVTHVEAPSREACGMDGQVGCRPPEVPVYRAADIPEAIRHAREAAGESGLICAFGSLYSIGSLKRALADLRDR